MVPPLRECGEDILVLAKAFLYCYATESQRKISGYEPVGANSLEMASSG